MDIFLVEKPDLVITDWMIPKADEGIEFVMEVRKHESLSDTPVIMVTGNTGVSDLKKAFEVGVNDYVRKPITDDNKEELLARVKAAVELHQLRNQIKEERDLLEKLLYTTFPVKIADKLKTRGKIPTQYYDKVSIIFTDFVGFTDIASRMPASKLMSELDDCFSSFDKIVQKYGLE